MELACSFRMLLLHGVIFRENVICILWISFSVTLTHCFPALPWHIVSQRHPDSLFPSVTLTLFLSVTHTHCFPALPWHCFRALHLHIVSQHYPDTLLLSVTLTHCFPGLPWHIVSQHYPDIVSEPYPDTLLLSVTLTHCCPDLPWHIVAQRYPDTLLPSVTLTHCIPARFQQNIVRSSARSRGINKKNWNTATYSKRASKNRGEFCLAVGSAGLIPVRYEQSLCSV